MEHKSGSETETSRFHAIVSTQDYFAWAKNSRVFTRPDVESRRQSLQEVVAKVIVPRLRELHASIERHPERAVVPREEEIEEFGALVMRTDLWPSAAYFEKLRDQGHSLDTLFLYLLEPTARYLGELWEQDLCDFVDVTIGVAHLQELLWVFGSKSGRSVSVDHRRALLMTPSCEHHAFGIDMVAEFMTAAGWDVTTIHKISLQDATTEAASAWFGVAGLALSSDAGLEPAAQTISAVRRASLNPKIRVLVGGPTFVRQPELALQVGADAVAQDAPTAVILAKKLLLASEI